MLMIIIYILFYFHLLLIKYLNIILYINYKGKQDIQSIKDKERKKKEYILSKNKFAELKLKKFYNLIALDKLSKYTEPEWGFPKGRRNANEMNLQCAIREFTEETNIDISDLHVLERLNYINEEYVGTNQLNYRHIYYVASSPTELELNTNDQINEIGKVEWFTIQNAIDKIRPYNNTRTKIIHQLYFFLINLIIGIKNNTNTLVQF
jgi:8-oxo-dGTP pyrophosphatase MutT (NUDIX family)